ncbi:glycosyltransferase family 9 protein [Diplocloster modestus]|uniref:Glycosyltransferase family 9 protein n=1 Tax=Diplocloster modestus TaxID=2850322 RepID=A0ABS6K3U4_9FIRM|nr:glycosyltransferase family 9 protein [Diplocloster modestus]MBU9725192.1 hypothetical protein [Diplocloster modestus]
MLKLLCKIKEALYNKILHAAAIHNLKRTDVNPGDENTIIIVKMDAIGDMVLYFENIRMIQNYYSNFKIILICQTCNNEIVRYFFPEIEVVPVGIITINQILFCKGFVQRLKKLSGGLLIQPVYNRTDLIEFIASCVMAPKRITIDGNNRKSKKIDQYYQVIKTEKETIMMFQRNKEFLEKLWNKDLVAVRFLPEQSLRSKKEYVVISPGGNINGKRWPIDKFAAVIQYITKTYHIACLLCGSSSEHNICSELLSKTEACKVKNLAGATSLIEMIEMIRGAVLYIGNDSAGIHIAAMYQIPSICIRPGYYKGQFLPYIEDVEIGQEPEVLYKNLPCCGCNAKYRYRTWDCIRRGLCGQSYPCVDAISEKEVIDIVDALLKE